MIAISFLFEEQMSSKERQNYIQQKNNSLPRSKLPTAERDSYIRERIAKLRSMIGKQGQSAKDINAQIQSYLKQKYNPGMGITQY